jgi:putative transposase
VWAMAEKSYPSDLSDAQWRVIEPFVGRPDPRGNPGKYEKRSVVNAILYVAREGCRWRSLPVNFPPWEVVYDHFRRWRERGVWEELAQVLARADRRRSGRETAPSVAIIDSQSVKTAGSGEERGFHGGKKVKGRSRHVVTDTGGRVLALRVTSARKGDSTEAGPTLSQAKERFGELETAVADQGYQAQARAEARHLGLALQVIEKKRARKASKCCHGAGSLKEHSPGLATSAASPKTTKRASKAPKPSSGSPAPSSSSTV